MAVLPKWPEKWVSKYRGTDEVFEFRISGNKVQYRPLGTYHGARQYLLLAGAIEKGDKIARSDVETAIRRLDVARREPGHVVFHQYDGETDLEEADE
jgi:Phage derived protein Gp49-like (DUF891)